MIQSTHSDPTVYLTRRADGAVLVRVQSVDRDGTAHPDAVFAFRSGDPQFAQWDERLKAQEVSLGGAARG